MDVKRVMLHSQSLPRWKERQVEPSWRVMASELEREIEIENKV